MERALKSFLEDSGLPHLCEFFDEQGVTLDILQLATRDELKELVPKLTDRIKLRNALENLQDYSYYESPTSPVAKHKHAVFKIAGPSQELDSGIVQNSSLQNDDQKTPTPVVVQLDNELATFANEQWEFIQEIGTLQDKKPLQELLESSTFGKHLLEKRTEGIKPNDRKQLVQLIVEHQLRILPSVKDTIRQECWSSWAQEICSIFPKEQPDIYYVPYRVNERQALPASGLLHNRLITHRRYLKSSGNQAGESRKRKSTSTTSSSGNSAESESGAKRLRPLPPACTSETADASVTADTLRDSIEWLQASSTPFELVLEKWIETLQERNNIIKKKTIEEYFNQFPALSLPNGYQLIEADFDRMYPQASDTFEENFPAIKKRILELLAEKQNVKAEPAIIKILEVASVGEEQASLAALRAIAYLLKQIAPLAAKGKPKFKPSRAEVADSFVRFLTSPSDIQRCIDDRMTLCRSKGMNSGPFIIAVGPSINEIQQYYVTVCNKKPLYQFADIKSALKCAFKVYFVLDIEYSSDAAPCWVLVQRLIFKIVTQYDTLYDKSVTLRELIKDCMKQSTTVNA